MHIRPEPNMSPVLKEQVLSLFESKFTSNILCHIKFESPFFVDSGLNENI